MSTYTPIATQILTSAVSSVTFNSIPQNYTDLVLVSNCGGSSSDYLQAVLNSDTANTLYSGTYILGTNASTQSGRYTGGTAGARYWIGGSTSTGTTSTGIVAIYNFQNYSNNAIYKTVLSRSSNANNTAGAMAALWRNTNAITSIQIKMADGSNIVSGSTFNLYGIDASLSAQAKATGGNSIYTDGTYWYHIFNQSGIFKPNVNLTADYLVVAGGGGGGPNADGGGTSSGGGGAGGLRCTVGATGGGGSLETPFSATNGTAYTITVGAGGVRGDYDAGQRRGGKGNNSSIFGTGLTTITSIGGGGGGYVPNDGEAGGSGGGAYSGATGGAGTANQGFAGNGFAGGGAGEAGGTDGLREGGDGITTSISGSSVTYAGGGGGGNGGGGGAGGGGAGATGAGDGFNGTANLGGGGGGSTGPGGSPRRFGGAGGSGIVIVRYSV